MLFRSNEDGGLAIRVAGLKRELPIGWAPGGSAGLAIADLQMSRRRGATPWPRPLTRAALDWRLLVQLSIAAAAAWRGQAALWPLQGPAL